MNELPPTPQTNALNRNLREACRDEYMYSEMLAFAQMLERERNEMRESIREAGNALIKASHVHRAITTYAQDQSEIDKAANKEHCEMLDAALAKLQPFLK
jgi:hypothetical protein